MEDLPCRVFCSELKVRSSIFIIIGASAGLPALVWSVSNLIHHRKKGHSISIFIILLLLTDFVELFMSPYILLKHILHEIPTSLYILLKHLLDEMFSSKDGAWRVLFSLCWSSRVYGILLNQMVALEGLLSVKYPLACVFSSPGFIILYIVVLLLVCIFTFILDPILTVPAVLIVSVITWIISCGVLCSAGCLSQTSRKPDYHILAIFIYTLLLLVLYVFMELYYSFSLSFIPNLLISLRLISDPLLCVLVCRQNIRIQTSQTSEEIVQSEEV